MLSDQWLLQHFSKAVLQSNTQQRLEFTWLHLRHKGRNAKLIIGDGVDGFCVRMKVRVRRKEWEVEMEKTLGNLVAGDRTENDDSNASE